MGAIQNALNQAAGAALASAGTMALAKGAQAAESQAKFNAQMAAAELPVEAKQKEIEMNESKRQQALAKNQKNFMTDLKARAEDPNVDVEGFKQEAEYLKKIYDPKMINAQYDTKKAQLSNQLAKRNVAAKKAQIKLINARVKELGIKGGNK